MYEELLDALFGGPEPDWNRAYGFMVNQHLAFTATHLVWLESHEPEEFDRLFCELVG